MRPPHEASIQNAVKVTQFIKENFESVTIGVGLNILFIVNT